MINQASSRQISIDQILKQIIFSIFIEWKSNSKLAFHFHSANVFFVHCLKLQKINEYN